MKKILYLLFLLPLSMVCQERSTRSNVIKQIPITTTERDSYVVPSGEVWYITLITGEKQKNEGGFGWVSDSIGDSAKPFGVADYNDSATSVTPISIIGDNTSVYLTNDALGAFTNEAYLPQGITSLYDSSTNSLDFSELPLGSKVDYRLDIDVTTTGSNQEVVIEIDLGINQSPYTLQSASRVFKAAGTYKINVSNFIYIGDINTKDNPAKFKIRSDGNATIVNNGIALGIYKYGESAGVSETTATIQAKRPLKTVNGQSLEGAGDLSVGGGTIYVDDSAADDTSALQTALDLGGLVELKPNAIYYISQKLISTIPVIIEGNNATIDSDVTALLLKNEANAVVNDLNLNTSFVSSDYISGGVLNVASTLDYVKYNNIDINAGGLANVNSIAIDATGAAIDLVKFEGLKISNSGRMALEIIAHSALDTTKRVKKFVLKDYITDNSGTVNEYGMGVSISGNILDSYLENVKITNYKGAGIELAKNTKTTVNSFNITKPKTLLSSPIHTSVRDYEYPNAHENSVFNDGYIEGDGILQLNSQLRPIKLNNVKIKGAINIQNRNAEYNNCYLDVGGNISSLLEFNTTFNNSEIVLRDSTNTMLTATSAPIYLNNTDVTKVGVERWLQLEANQEAYVKGGSVTGGYISGSAGSKAVFSDLDMISPDLDNPKRGDVTYYESNVSVDGVFPTVSGGISDGDYGQISVSNSGTAINIDANSITTANLQNESITLQKLAPSSVIENRIGNNAVSTRTLANAAVTTVKMAPSSTNGQVLKTVNGSVQWSEESSSGNTLSGEKSYISLNSGDLTATSENFINSSDASATRINEFTGATSMIFGAGITTTRTARFDGSETSGVFELIPDNSYRFEGVVEKDGDYVFIQENEKLRCQSTDKTNINYKSGNVYVVETTCEVVSTLLPSPNASNTNPELMVNYAFGFGTDNTDAIPVDDTGTIQRESSGSELNITSFADTSNNYGGTHIARLTQTNTGSADYRLKLTGLTQNTAYEVYVYTKTSGGQTARFRLYAGNGFTDLTSTSTIGEVVNGSYTTAAGFSELTILVDPCFETDDVGEYVDFLISVKEQ